MIGIFLSATLSFVPMMAKDTSFVVFDPFVDTCKVVFRIEPSVNHGARLKNIRIIRHNVKKWYFNYDYNCFYDFPYGYDSCVFGTELSPEDQYICNKYVVDAFSRYHYIDSLDGQHIIRDISLDILPKKAFIEIRDSLSALSDSLTKTNYVLKKRLDYVSPEKISTLRKRIFSVLDYRFNSADSIYVVELFNEKKLSDARFITLSVYSPDMFVSQSWRFNKKEEMRRGNSGISVYSIDHLNRIINLATTKDSQSEEDDTSVYNILLITKREDGSYYVSKYYRTVNSWWQFWPKN